MRVLCAKTIKHYYYVPTHEMDSFPPHINVSVKSARGNRVVAEVHNVMQEISDEEFRYSMQ